MPGRVIAKLDPGYQERSEARSPSTYSQRPCVPVRELKHAIRVLS